MTEGPAVDQRNPDRYVTLWSRGPDDVWVIHRSSRLTYWRTAYPACRETGRWIYDGREYQLFERGVDPNNA